MILTWIGLVCTFSLNWVKESSGTLFHLESPVLVTLGIIGFPKQPFDGIFSVGQRNTTGKSLFTRDAARVGGCTQVLLVLTYRMPNST